MSAEDWSRFCIRTGSLRRFVSAAKLIVVCLIVWQRCSSWTLYVQWNADKRRCNRPNTCFIYSQTKIRFILIDTAQICLMPFVSFPTTVSYQQTKFVSIHSVAADTWLPLSIHSWRLTGSCAVVLAGDGWDLQFPLPGNVSCCETMWQKISTAVMAQQCSLPLYVLLPELI